MTFEAFRDSLENATPPVGDAYLQSLWFDAKGDWDKAHTIIQDIEDSKAAWVHAYLHRKEGDAGNAGYWYRKAGKPMPGYALEKEWQELVQAML